MPKRKITFVNDQFYHVYNRGVEKRDIFMNEKDKFRFGHNLSEFNDQDVQSVPGTRRVPGTDSELRNKKQNPLVEIVCFGMMPNHYHLILKQLVDNGIPLFMQKQGGGYANYFNIKYERVGSLFQGPYKAIHIDNENYLLHLSRYIHLNIVALIEPKWKEEGIKDLKKVKEFLRNYRWSSYLDYIGIGNFPSLINTELIMSYFESPKAYEEFVLSWLVDDLKRIEKLTLEK